jgi:hypothetical protein
MSPPKVNDSMIMDLNNKETDKMENNELKRTMIKIISEIKEELFKHLNEFKKDTNKQLSELK